MSEKRRTYICRGDQIERLRQNNGLSLERLASRAGIHIRTLNRILGGKPAYLTTIATIATVLGVDCETLLSDRRSDIEMHNAGTTTTFNLSIALSGTVPNDRVGVLTRISSRVLAALASEGITIESHQTTLAIKEWSQDQLCRWIVLLFGILKNGGPCWIFATVKPSRWLKFLLDHKAGRIEIYKFQPYGEIICSGTGDMPDEQAVQHVAKIFGIEDTDVLTRDADIDQMLADVADRVE